MNARTIDRIETNLERAVAVLFGAAVGYAVYSSLNASVAQAQLSAFTGVSAATACFLCRRALAAVGAQKPRYKVAIFDVRELDTFDSGELILTDADRLDNELVLTDADRIDSALLLTEADRFQPLASEEPLVLTDVLYELGSDSRVVRLFDPSKMPTPGQLKSRVDRHLEREAPPAAPSDASQALSEALAELRRSLR
jgi:hypothetical protein